MKQILLIILGLSTLIWADFTRSDNIVADSTTGLQWQDDVISSTMIWTEAIEYCESLPLGGYSDWRLPNLNELTSIVDDSRIVPSINTAVFQNVASNYYWSSTTYAGNTSGAWYVYFNNGRQGGYYKDGSNYVRCVRAGQIDPLTLVPILSTIDIPYHIEIKPESFFVYISNIDNFDVTKLTASLSIDTSLPVKSVTAYGDSLKIELPFLSSGGDHTLTLSYDGSSANIALHLESVPFRIGDEYWAFEYTASGDAGWKAALKIELAGVDFEVGTGVGVSAEAALSLNGSTKSLVALSRDEGEFLYGSPRHASVELKAEASAFKIALKDPTGVFIDMEAKSLSGEASFKGSTSVVVYPQKYHFPRDKEIIALHTLPEMLSVLPLDIYGLYAIDVKGTDAYKWISVKSLQFQEQASFLNAAVDLAGSDGKLKVTSGILSASLGLGEAKALQKWVWIDGEEDGGKIDLLRTEYKWGLDPATLRLSDIWQFDAPGRGNFVYFERGIEKDQYIARFRLSLGDGESYLQLDNDANYKYNEITYYLNSDDHTSLKDDFSIQNLARHSFTTPTRIESWLLTDDDALKFGIVKIKAQLGLGLGGGISLLTNSHERALAGVGYKKGEVIYPIYHNVLDANLPFAKQVYGSDMRSDKPHDILIESIKLSAVELKEKIKESIFGILKDVTEVVVDVGNKVKEVYDGSVKMVKYGFGNLIQIYKTGWNDIVNSQVEQFMITTNELQTFTPQTPLVNNANLEFVSDMLEVIVDQNVTHSEVIIWAVYGSIDNAGIYKFEDNKWQRVNTSLAEEGGLAFIPVQSGYYAMIKDFVDVDDIFVKEFTTVDTDMISSIESEVLHLSTGEVASGFYFNVSVASAFSTVDGKTEFDNVPFVWSEVVQTNSNGILRLDLDANISEGYAHINIHPIRGYGSDALEIYVADPSNSRPVEDFNITIEISETIFSIGDTINTNISIGAESYSDLMIFIVTPDGQVIYNNNLTALMPGEYTIHVRVTDENGYIHTKELKVLVKNTCSYLFTPSKELLGSSGGEEMIEVTSEPFGCEDGSWSISESLDWITLDGNLSGTGFGVWQVDFNVSANPGQKRTGEIETSDGMIIISQDLYSQEINPAIIMYLLN